MSTDEQIESAVKDVQASSAEQKPAIERLKLMERLFALDDFKDFNSWYLEEEAKRIGEVLTSTTPLASETIAVLQEKQLAIRHYKLFIASIEAVAVNAQLVVESNDEYIERLRTGNSAISEGI